MHVNETAHITIEPITMHTVSFLNGQPLVKFCIAEVDQMNVIEGLQYAVVGKIAYG